MTKHALFREYCEKTTLPGMKYFVMNHRSLIERLIEFILFFIKLIFIFIVYTKFIVIAVTCLLKYFF